MTATLAAVAVYLALASPPFPTTLSVDRGSIRYSSGVGDRPATTRGMMAPGEPVSVFAWLCMNVR